MRTIADIPADLLRRFRDGMVIPALPLALDAERRPDPRRQRALLRYYHDAGAGGIAVGVHSTQFAIHRPEVGLYRPLLGFAAAVLDHCREHDGGREVLRIAGVCGDVHQARAEAATAGELGYHACLVSLVGVDPEAALAHCRAVAGEMPILGFYLQRAAHGPELPYGFWREFAALDNVLGIKVAPFDRYRTLDVVRAVIDAGAAQRVTLYTGNDDTIVHDLLTPFRHAGHELHFTGGLLGQWGVWTQRAVELLERIKAVRAAGIGADPDLLALAAHLTDANGALFDATNGFAGCIPGIHEGLRRSGLLAGTWCLDPDEQLSPGQAAEIARVATAYPELVDDAFVAAHRERWLADDGASLPALVPETGAQPCG